MKWKRSKGRKDRDVIDIRGAEQPSGGGASGGGLGGLPIPGSMAGVGGTAGIVVLLVVIAIQVFGGGGESGFNFGPAFGGGAQAPGADDPAPIPPDQDPQRDLKEFSTYVFNDVQNTWTAIFKKEGKSYDHAQLVLYSNAVSTGGCGGATSAVGPFYCSGDSRVYLDLSFFDEMKAQLGAPGDFAWAYVIAHEVGHHVQNLLGTNDEVADQENSDNRNELSVRTELQADCYAGVWASTVFKEGDLEDGDIDEAFTATEAVGDDTLAREAGRRVNTDSFTHGSAEQRRHWFTVGYESGDPANCDTFSPDSV
jgi:predicted metalloprotease